MPEIVKRDKLTDECPSEWQLALLALGLADDEMRVRAQVARCTHCQTRLQRIEAEQRTVADEQLPAMLSGRVAAGKLEPRRDHRGVRAMWRSRATRWLATSCALAALSVLVIVLRPMPAPQGTRVKGTPTPHATVLRDGKIIADDVALDTLVKLHAGDRMRLRVPAGMGTVRVEGTEADGWMLYYQGTIPADGWLPIGIVVTNQGASRLRFLHCDGALPADGGRHDDGRPSDGCREHIFTL